MADDVKTSHSCGGRKIWNRIKECKGAEQSPHFLSVFRFLHSKSSVFRFFFLIHCGFRFFPFLILVFSVLLFACLFPRSNRFGSLFSAVFRY